MSNDISSRRPMITPKVQLVATFKQDLSPSEIRAFKDRLDQVLMEEYGDLVDNVTTDNMVNSIGVSLITALWMDDVSNIASIMEQTIEQQGAEVDGGVQIQAITERTVV